MPNKPPTNFLPALEVSDAKIIPVPAFARANKYKGKRLEGVRYERKAQDYLVALFPDYVPGFWLQFNSNGIIRYCQPDGLHFDIDKGIITIVEMKYQHTSLAWWQLYHLYYPVLLKLFPEPLWQYNFCEIVKWYDPAIAFPCEVKLTGEPFRPSPKFKVHIWRA